MVVCFFVLIKARTGPQFIVINTVNNFGLVGKLPIKKLCQQRGLLKSILNALKIPISKSKFRTVFS